MCVRWHRDSCANSAAEAACAPAVVRAPDCPIALCRMQRDGSTVPAATAAATRACASRLVDKACPIPRQFMTGNRARLRLSHEHRQQPFRSRFYVRQVANVSCFGFLKLELKPAQHAEHQHERGADRSAPCTIKFLECARVFMQLCSPSGAQHVACTSLPSRSAL